MQAHENVCTWVHANKTLKENYPISREFLRDTLESAGFV